MSGLVLPFPSTSSAPPAPGGVHFHNGLVPVVSARQLIDEEKARASLTQNTPVITGLAGHVRKCFDAAVQAKRNSGIEERLNQCVRQRRGEYDPDILAEIKKQGGSEIYMMLSAAKCRGASALLKNVMSGKRNQAPWDIEPTKEPSLNPEDTQAVVAQATQEAMQVEMGLGVDMMNPEFMRDVVQRIADRKLTVMKDMAERRMHRMRSKMEDQLQEGGYYQTMSSFVDDLVTFPFAIVKGPVPRKHKCLQWVPQQDGTFTPDIKETIQLDWDRVDAFKAYWAPHATEIDEGFFIEHHQLTPTDLEALIGTDNGYDEAAIRAVLDEYGTGGLRDWLMTWNASEHAESQGQSLSALLTNPDSTMDALQFWGSIQGKMLVEWGMDEKQVPDQLKSYDCEVWLIGRWVIKAALNANPLGKKPYYKTSYEKIPGSFAGNGVCDLVRDTQRMCNGAARSLANNMGIASGPMVWINSQRMATGEDVTQLYPWRIFQGISDPYANSTDQPITFFQPQSNAQELMAIYDRFSVLADEYSSVPRYMTGDGSAGGAGRTASGMSMMVSNAGRSIEQVVGNVDLDITRLLIERLYYTNMRYSEDPELKGDVRVVARGVNALLAKEAAQLRMNEILQIVANSELLIGIVGEEAVADLLREITKPLNMDIVPDKEVIRARMIQRQQMAMAQQILAQQQGQVIEGESTRVDGKKTMPGNKQKLQDGAPVVDNFAPSRRG